MLKITFLFFLVTIIVGITLFIFLIFAFGYLGDRHLHRLKVVKSKTKRLPLEEKRKSSLFLIYLISLIFFILIILLSIESQVRGII